ncbi:signal peptidase I [Aeromicrobium sp.]|uniref:signal peptidase I n=1 Tax=Aeromicrobium sp. TaxID=1871063 RepID=UPI0030BCD3F0
MSKRRAEHLSITGWLSQVFAWFVLSALLLVLAVSVLVPRLAGATPYTVLTGSMEPGMSAGTLVVVRPVDAKEIGVGTVITFQLESGEPTVVTHRVVGQGADREGRPVFRTQGDANSAPDAMPVRVEQIKGERWYSVPYLGRVTNVVTSTQRQLALTVVVIGLLTCAATMFLGAIRGRQKKTIEEEIDVTS